ncbi:MAG: hypothetical protein V1754_14460 [Pseudomonadota bacterium]
MQRNLTIRFLHVCRSNELVGLIDHDFRRLQDYHPQILRCSVVVEKPHRRHNKGNCVRAQVGVALLGKALVSSKEAEGTDDLDSGAIAIAKAFDSTRLSVEAYLGKRRVSNVKFLGIQHVV